MMTPVKRRASERNFTALLWLGFISAHWFCFSGLAISSPDVIESDDDLRLLKETESLIGLDFEAEYTINFYQVVPRPIPVTPPGASLIDSPWEPGPEDLELGQYQKIHYWQHGEKMAWEKRFGDLFLPSEIRAKYGEGWEKVIYDGFQYVRWRQVSSFDEIVERRLGRKPANVFISRNAPPPNDLITPINVFSFGKNRPLAETLERFVTAAVRVGEDGRRIVYRVAVETTEGAKPLAYSLHLDTSRHNLPCRTYLLGSDTAYIAKFAKKWMRLRNARFPQGRCELPCEVWWQLLMLDKELNMMCVVSHMVLQVSRMSLDPVDAAVFDVNLRADDVVTFIKK